MATDVLFTGVPAVPDASDGAPGLSLGTRIEVVNAGWFIGIRWRFPDTLPGATVQWRVDGYNPATDASTGTVRSGTFTAPVAGTYVTESFAALAVSPGDEFVAYIWTPDRYVGTTNFFLVNVNSVSGNYLGPADDTGVPARRNGRFNVGGAITYPTSGSNRFGYFVDVVWSDTEGTVTGVLDATLPGLTSELDGEATASGDLDAVLPGLTADLNGEALASGVLTGTLPALLADIVGLVPASGILTGVLPGLVGQFEGVSAAGGATVGPCGWSRLRGADPVGRHRPPVRPVRDHCAPVWHETMCGRLRRVLGLRLVRRHLGSVHFQRAVVQLWLRCRVLLRSTVPGSSHGSGFGNRRSPHRRDCCGPGYLPSRRRALACPDGWGVLAAVRGHGHRRRGQRFRGDIPPRHSGACCVAARCRHVGV